jgi:hypothetical protein
MDLPVCYGELDWQQRRAVREEYRRRQGDLCRHCKAPLTGPPSAEVRAKKVNRRLFPPTMFDHPIHLHHSHTTGLTLGAVHCYCNAVLWQYHGE